MVWAQPTPHIFFFMTVALFGELTTLLPKPLYSSFLAKVLLRIDTIIELLVSAPP